MFIATLFKIARTWKQPKCPLTGMDKDVRKMEWIKKYNGILLSHKKE